MSHECLGIVTEMSAMDTAPKILASLRIWSDEYDLSKIASSLSIYIDKVHRKAERELVRAPDRHYTYRSHFVNSGDDLLPNLDSIHPWLSCCLSSIEQAPSVPALLRIVTI